ncbi:MAG: copper amine oxidase N-terminal domain-containing protein [Syntrophomonadaceae bacterium]|nr:copper amine oxidase N-terminal domain-containing protein [Syntrophomonadaceae bacterium]
MKKFLNRSLSLMLAAAFIALSTASSAQAAAENSNYLPYTVDEFVEYVNREWSAQYPDIPAIHNIHSLNGNGTEFQGNWGDVCEVSFQVDLPVGKILVLSLSIHNPQTINSSFLEFSYLSLFLGAFFNELDGNQATAGNLYYDLFANEDMAAEQDFTATYGHITHLYSVTDEKLFYRLSASDAAFVNKTYPAENETDKVAAEKANSDIIVLLNGKPMSFKDPAQYVDGQVLISALGLAEELNGQIQRINKSDRIMITGDDVTIEFGIGDKVVYIDGAPIAVKIPALMYNNKVYLPAEWVSAVFNAQVTWDDSSRTCKIVQKHKIKA